MKRKIKILLLTLIFGISSCSNSFITRTKSKNIKLYGIDKKSVKVGAENEKAIILFDRNELITLFQNDLAVFYDQSVKIKIDELNSLKSDLIFPENEMKGKLKFIEYELKFLELLKAGKAKVINKESNEKVERIKYTFTMDKLGGQNGYFSFINGEEFYKILIALGE